VARIKADAGIVFDDLEAERITFLLRNRRAMATKASTLADCPTCRATVGVAAETGVVMLIYLDHALR
jgi:Cu/Ag efflux pump CusA